MYTIEEIASRVQSIGDATNIRMDAFLENNDIAVVHSEPLPLDTTLNYQLWTRMVGMSAKFNLPRNFPNDSVERVKQEVFAFLAVNITVRLAFSEDNRTLYNPTYEYSYSIDTNTLSVHWRVRFLEVIRRAE